MNLQFNNFGACTNTLQFTNPKDQCVNVDDEVEEIPKSVVPASLKGKKKGPSKRGKAFSREEDLLICLAWLNVSKDATADQFVAYKAFF
jgi:hypothetical protein